MRKSTTKTMAILAFSTLFALTAAGCSGSGTKKEATSSASGTESTPNNENQTESTQAVVVGLLHSLTGPMAISEKSVRDAEILAITEINQDGCILGKTIAYIEEDGAS